MYFRSNSSVGAILVAVVNNWMLYREAWRVRPRAAVQRLLTGAQFFANPRSWGTSLKVFRALTAREIQPIVRADPRVAAKYFDGEYLATHLSRAERALILIDHYTFFKHRVKSDFFRTIVDRRIMLWTHEVENCRYSIGVSFSHKYHREGDLSLIFQCDGGDVYLLSFTIGPGSVAGLVTDHVVYIARMQGCCGLPQVRSATKNCLDIAPAALLLAAMEGVALALGLVHIVGIGADEQLATRYSRRGGVLHAYDELWVALGGAKLDRNMYHLSAPVSQKPIGAIKSKYRSRTLRKRAFKQLVREQVHQRFEAVGLRSREQEYV